MRALILPLLALTVAACGEAGEPSSAVIDGAATANAAAPVGFTAVQRRVIDLSPRLRDGVLFRAIRDGEAECQGIADSVRQADQEGRPVWATRCTDGSTYLIAVGPDGVAQVTKVSGDRARG